MKNLLKDNPLIVLDVGAAGGIHDRWRNLGSSVRAILFEPDIEEYEKLVAENSESSIIINSALAEKQKSVDFNICQKQQVSSIYKPNKPLLDKYEDSERFNVQKTISMEANSIDNLLLKENINEIDFIKIDTQGSELDILKGATNFYTNLIGIEVEVEFIELYHCQPLFSEVNNFIESQGFKLIDLKRYFWKRKSKNYSVKKGQLIFGDALYFKDPESIMALENLTEEKIIKSIYIYLSYGYDDLARTILDLSEKSDLVSKESIGALRIFIRNYKSVTHSPYIKIIDLMKRLIKYLLPRIFPRKFFTQDQHIGN